MVGRHTTFPSEVSEHGAIRRVRVALDTAYLDRVPIFQAARQARVLVRVSACLLNELRSDALMLDQARIIHARVEATLS